MSQEAVTTLAALEEKLRRQRADAAAAAKEAVAAAKAQGEQMVADAVKRAGDEIGALRRQMEENAKAKAQEKASQLENREAGLRAKAEDKSAGAIALIVERIVNG